MKLSAIVSEEQYPARYVDKAKIKHVLEVDLGLDEGDDYVISDDYVVSEAPNHGVFGLKIPGSWKTIPIQLGEFPNADLDIRESNLGTLQNAPTLVKSMVLTEVSRLASLVHCPKVIEESLTIYNCGLTSLRGAPTKIGGRLELHNLKLLSTLAGLEHTQINGRLLIENCDSLTSLDGLPKGIGGSFMINECPKLEAIKLPREFDIGTGRLYVGPGMDVKLSPQLVVVKSLREINWYGSVGFRDDILKIFNEYLKKPKTNYTYLELQAELIDRDFDWLAEL